MLESAGLGLSSASRMVWARRIVGLVMCLEISLYISLNISMSIDSFLGDDGFLEKSNR